MFVVVIYYVVDSVLTWQLWAFYCGCAKHVIYIESRVIIQKVMIVR